MTDKWTAPVFYIVEIEERWDGTKSFVGPFDTWIKAEKWIWDADPDDVDPEYTSVRTVLNV